MSKQKKSLFWASYADLMTSMFFIMLTLFVASSILLSKKGKEWRDMYFQSEDQKQQLQRINDVIQDLDSTYFEYIDLYKKSKLVIPVNFGVDQYNINGLPKGTRDELEKAGKSLKAFVDETTKKYPGVQYILIIEGQASRTGGTDHNYELSYRRAYSLKKYWEDEDIKFDALNCEVLIGGSGDGIQSGTGLMREDPSREYLNQRFLIHILPKPGYVKNESVATTEEPKKK
jgi:outer membrane protein OmpA-like peptidoglycan-associated protein